MNRYRTLGKISLMVVVAVALAALLTGTAAADMDPYLDVNFHSFTLDGDNTTCIPYDDSDVGQTRNCDPVNLVFPGRTWQEVRELLLADDWSTSGGGSSQWLYFSGSGLIVEDEQLFKPGTLFGPRYHIRLWQAPSSALVTLAAVHHEDFIHNIDMDWEVAEADVASALCAPDCQQAYLPSQDLIQGEDGEWRGWDNDGSATVIPAPGAPNASPLASFTYSCADLSCVFDASGSSDADGNIVDFAWDFGDGNGVNSSEATASHTYATAGTYTVLLTVTDNEGATGTDSQSVTVNEANYLPIVTFSVSCSGLSCAFDGSDSYDPDGAIVNYAWDFGDGQGDSGSEAMSNHTYATAGSYSVLLTVTDDDGDMAAESQDVSVADAQATTMHVGDLEGLSIVKKNWVAEVTITVHDETEGLVSGATVRGDWSGDASGTSSCVTDGSGTCTVLSAEMPKKTTQQVIFTVTEITHSTLTLSYVAGDNHDPQGNSNGTAILVDKDSGAQDPGGTPGQISLWVMGYKVKGVQQAELNWSGASSAEVDIWRNGNLLATWPSGGTPYPDDIGQKGGGSYRYQVCEAGTAVCSAEVWVEF